MILLKEFLPLVMSDRVTHPELIKIGNVLPHLITNIRCFIFGEINVLVMRPSTISGVYRPPIDLDNGILNLPFQTCGFEHTISKQESSEIVKRLIIVHEKSPGDYLFIQGEWDAHNKLYIGAAAKGSNKDVYAKLMAVTCGLCDEIETSFVGNQKINEKIKVRIKGKNENIFIKNVVYVSKRKVTPQERPNGYSVDYSHRFEVMGHWRKIENIGKDRKGDYGIQGYTWVVPHVKGPESKPVIKKQRVVIGERASM